jgi:hypothetical protein
VLPQRLGAFGACAAEKCEWPSMRETNGKPMGKHGKIWENMGKIWKKMGKYRRKALYISIITI